MRRGRLIGTSGCRQLLSALLTLLPMLSLRPRKATGQLSHTSAPWLCGPSAQSLGDKKYSHFLIPTLQLNIHFAICGNPKERPNRASPHADGLPLTHSASICGSVFQQPTPSYRNCSASLSSGMLARHDKQQFPWR